MNYIWEVIIKGKDQGVEPKDITFSEADVFSPYMEVSKKYLNLNNIEEEVGINPYYRFYDIFKGICNVNYLEDKELREFLFDIIVHFLANLDLNQGLSKKELYMQFIYRDIKKGHLGEKIKESIEYFKKEEKQILLRNIFKLYTIGAEISLFKNTVKNIFKHSLVYIKRNNEEKVLVFLNTKRDKENKKKIHSIIDIFLPINFKVDIYYENHFGIIGIDETMLIDEIEIY